MIRRFGAPPHKNQSYRSRPGVYALLPRDGQLLLTCQLQPEPEVQLPGGGIDPGESPLPALHREVLRRNRLENRDPQTVGGLSAFCFYAGI